MQKGKFYAVGTGAGEPEYLTLKAKHVIENADVLFIPVKSKGAVSYAFESVKNIVNLENVTVCEAVFPMNPEADFRKEFERENIKKFTQILDSGRNVVMITLGDVSVYSTCTYAVQKLRQLGYSTEIVAGIPSFCAGMAEAGESLCEGDESLMIISGTRCEENIDRITELADNVVIMKAGRILDKIYDVLEKQNRLDSAIVFSCIGMENEYIGHIQKAENISYFTTVVIKNKKYCDEQ